MLDSQSVQTVGTACAETRFDKGKARAKKVKCRKRQILCDSSGLLIAAIVHEAADRGARLWLNKQRRLSKDYKALTETSEAMVYLAMIRLTLARLDLWRQRRSAPVPYILFGDCRFVVSKHRLPRTGFPV
jgi:hypothetical protein